MYLLGSHTWTATTRRGREVKASWSHSASLRSSLRWLHQYRHRNGSNATSRTNSMATRALTSRTILLIKKVLIDSARSIYVEKYYLLSYSFDSATVSCNNIMMTSMSTHSRGVDTMYSRAVRALTEEYRDLRGDRSVYDCNFSTEFLRCLDPLISKMI
jgi:hypothetical protein